MYNYFDPAQVGWGGILAAIASVLGLSVAFSLLTSAIHEIRGGLVRRVNRDSHQR